jgi:hypothetical protein
MSAWVRTLLVGILVASVNRSEAKMDGAVSDGLIEQDQQRHAKRKAKNYEPHRALLTPAPIMVFSR